MGRLHAHSLPTAVLRECFRILFRRYECFSIVFRPAYRTIVERMAWPRRRGYDAEIRGAIRSPTSALAWSRPRAPRCRSLCSCRRAAYTEQAVSGTNTFALNYGAKSVTASRSEMGVRTDKSWAMTDAIFTLRGRLAWGGARLQHRPQYRRHLPDAARRIVRRQRRGAGA
jgi:Autotransporter beta-domain